MESMKELDRCVTRINIVQRNSVKLLDAFVRTSNTIERCTTRVNNDCVALHACQYNVESTLKELNAASRCFEMPPGVASVLRRQDRTPLGLAKAIEYFTSVLDYLLEHLPSNSSMIDRTERRLATIDSIVEREIIGCLQRSMGLQVAQDDPFAGSLSMTVASPKLLSSSLAATMFSNHNFDDGVGMGGGGLQIELFPERSELASLSELTRTAFSAFDRTELFEEGIPTCILNRIKQLMDPLFDAAYMEVFEPATFHGFASSGVVLGEAAQAARKGGNSRAPKNEAAVFAAIAEVVRTGSHLGTSTADALNVTEEDFEVVEVTAALEKDGWRSPKHLISTASPLSRRNYRKGDHLLLKTSAWGRAMVLEASEVLNEVLLVPLRDDFAVSEVPASVASVVFTCILRHAFQSIYLPQQLLDATATEMFLLSGGTGYGLVTMNGSRTLRDCLFIGLDLLEELWLWREVASGLSGESYRFADVVEEGIGAFAKQVGAILECWRSRFGSIDQKILVQGDRLRSLKGEGSVAPGWDSSTLGALHGLAVATTEQGIRFELSAQTGRRCWAPAYDCAPHEATVNFLFVTRSLFEDYLGALKLVLNGGDVGAAEDAAVMVELEEMLSDSTAGHLNDIRALVVAHLALQHLLGDVEKDDPNAPSSNGINHALFVLNNVTYIEDGLKREPFASKTKLVRESGVASSSSHTDPESDGHDGFGIPTRSVFVEPVLGGNGSRGGGGGAAPVVLGAGRAALTGKRLVRRSIAQPAIDIAHAEIPDLLREYEEKWAEVFPSLDAGSAPTEIVELARTTKSQTPLLNKKQRMVLKYHHELVAKQLATAIDAARLHTVHDPNMRVQLVERAMGSVKTEFGRLEADLVKGRLWSNDPNKWLVRSAQEWVTEVAKIL